MVVLNHFPHSNFKLQSLGRIPYLQTDSFKSFQVYSWGYKSVSKPNISYLGVSKNLVNPPNYSNLTWDNDDQPVRLVGGKYPLVNVNRTLWTTIFCIREIIPFDGLSFFEIDRSYPDMVSGSKTS